MEQRKVWWKVYKILWWKRVALYSRYRCYKKYNIDWFLEKEEFLDYKGRREYNNKISEIIKLSFEPDDIKYIIVNSEDEILDLFRAIDNIKGDKYSLNRINILKTCIISKDQILNDF